MTDPEEKLLAAIREEESDLADALAEANDILYPDPAKALAVAISERKTAVREWKDCLKQCDALTADLEAIRGLVGLPEVPIVEAVRRYCDRPALPADLRAYLETRRDRLQGGHGLAVAAEIAALKRWIALPTAEVAP